MTVISPNTSVLPLSVAFHQRSLLGFTYMLLLPGGKTGEAWEPSKKQIGKQWIDTHVGFYRLYLAAPWLRRSVAGLPPRRARFDPSSVHVRFVVENMALGQDFLPVLQFSPVSTIPPILHTHSCTIDATHNLSKLLRKVQKRRLVRETVCVCGEGGGLEACQDQRLRAPHVGEWLYSSTHS